MKRSEYEIELKALYGEAVKFFDFRLAFDILEAGRALGFEDMNTSRIKTEEKENG